MKKTFILVIAVLLTISMFGSSFAAEPPVIAYKNNTMTDLKTRINEEYSKKTISDTVKEDIIKDTNPDILAEFMNEKSKAAKKALEEMNGEEVVLTPNPSGVMSYERTIDLGDNCSVTIEMMEGNDESTFAKLHNFFIEPVYAVSQSGGDSVWKGYGNRYFTAKARVNYAVATAAYILENHYNLSESGIKERYGTEGSSHSGLMKVSPNSPVITQSTATQVGQYVRMQCTYNTSYSIPTPIELEWGKTHIMKTSVKYVALDYIDKEIHVTQEWTFTNL